jgi:TolB-like protein/DNA-binding winged helix-turn-helix (wHTH) protein/Tfp pilus assembly protein PilF
MPSAPLHFQDFELDSAQFELRRAGHRIRLERKPLELLILLAEKRGSLVSREEIIQRVWGDDVYFDAERGINNAIRKIRAALHDESGQPHFVETVIGKGYRFIAPLNGEGRGGTTGAAAAATSPNAGGSQNTGAAPAVPPVGAEAGEPERISWVSRAARRRRFLGVTGVILAIFAIVLTLNVDRLRRRHLFPISSPPRIRSLAVLPFRNLSGDPAQEYLADGMTEALIGRLSMIGGLRVISRTSVMSLKDTKLSAPDIAKMLQVDALVEGSVIRQGGHIRVYAQLVRAATDEHFWSEAYDRDLGDVLALQSDVAQAVTRKVEVTVTGEEHARLAAAHQVSPEVYEDYLKGQFAKGNSRAEIEQSIASFQAAIAKDATFAPAYVGLANAYERLGGSFVGVPPAETRPKAIRAARKALELDPELAEAHAVLGRVLKKQFRWADAEAEYKQALALNPNNATAHLEYGEWLLSYGRIDEALAWSRRARELDPLGDASISIGWILFQAHRYDESIGELRSFLAVHSDDAIAHLSLAFPMIATGQAKEAIPDLEKTASLMNRSPGALELLATAHARAGNRGGAVRLLQELKQREKTGYVQATSFINPNLALGNYDEALAWLERAYKQQEGILQWVKVHPFFDPVRSDPRFKDLQRRVGLDESR